MLHRTGEQRSRRTHTSYKEANSGCNLATELVPLAHSVTLRVLIVDDEVSVRRVMAVVLTRLGFPCEKAESGEKHLPILEAQRIEAVISDLQIPGMAGMDVLIKE